MARRVRIHLAGEAGGALCRLQGGEMTGDILMADCRSCLWTLAKVCHMQMAGALKRIEELEGVVVEGPPEGAKRG